MRAQVAFPDNMTEMSKDFISQALKKHPGDRPTVIEMLNHPWISMFKVWPWISVVQVWLWISVLQVWPWISVLQV